MQKKFSHPNLPEGYSWPVGHSATSLINGVEWLLWIVSETGNERYLCVGKPTGDPNHDEEKFQIPLEQLENII